MLYVWKHSKCASERITHAERLFDPLDLTLKCAFCHRRCVPRLLCAISGGSRLRGTLTEVTSNSDRSLIFDHTEPTLKKKKKTDLTLKDLIWVR